MKYRFTSQVCALMLLLSSTFFATLFAQTATKSSQPSAETIKIGISIVTSDPTGSTQLQGAKMAIEEINAAGGVLGKKLELLPVYNENRNYPKAQALVKTMIDEGAKYIITSGGSGMTMKAAEITIPANVMLITGSSSSPKISELNDNDLVWRTVPSDAFQGRIAAVFMDSLKIRSAGIIHLDNPYGNELGRTFREVFERRRGKVLATSKIPDATNYQNLDFKQLVDAVFSQKPQLIYIIGSGEESAKVINTAKSYFTKDYRPQLLGCDANYNNDFLYGAEQTLIEGMQGFVYIHPQNYPNFEKFAKAFEVFQSKVSNDAAEMSATSLASLLGAVSTNSYGATVYDAIYSIAYSMLKAKSINPFDVAKQMREVANDHGGATVINVGEFAKASSILAKGGNINYDGASGSLEFNDTGDVTTGTYIIWKVKDGKFVEASTISFP
ncbi:MAG: ABC transporter substrate-binding protein [Candidatus Kapabacteria bacterium]|jgi:ABC-type branched-subunit amino acid transport system substrate-binding protein|nr:ABC transporter substrate-binding protein [Candidatus Kapabacteria bacterium]